uniref:Uncharacterized protein n=2 Tax=Pan TaxID=9596 RepID=A0A2I3SY05_PANTR
MGHYLDCINRCYIEEITVLIYILEDWYILVLAGKYLRMKELEMSLYIKLRQTFYYIAKPTAYELSSPESGR